MKKKKLDKKTMLNKVTIANLDTDELVALNGGIADVVPRQFTHAFISCNGASICFAECTYVPEVCTSK